MAEGGSPDKGQAGTEADRFWGEGAMLTGFVLLCWLLAVRHLFLEWNEQYSYGVLGGLGLQGGGHGIPMAE